ncbi:MAG: HAD-IIIA family hydrolase [Phycisphaerales bacterium]|nr:MAG: HAD-IIIA family hydrolase [Phycisphaerales bacterium]
MLSPEPAIIEPIRLLVTDVDGVLTDGHIVYDDAGRETKRFSVQDGSAIKMWMALGRPFGVITCRRSAIVDRRMAELGVSMVHQGADQKGTAIETMMARAEAELAQTCYIGDDLADLSAMKRVGLPVAVGNAAPEVKRAARWITARSGGDGAVRETIEYLLRRQGLWAEALQRFAGQIHG